MSEVRVNKLSPRSGTTVTLGDSGDTITIPSGVTFDASSGGLAGTLTTAAQPNITSVGTLTSFTSTGIDDNATSTAITISSSGLVGIGTTSPNHKFELLGGTPSVSIKSDNPTNGSSNIIFGDTNDDDIGKIFYEHGTNSFRFLTNASERMRIDSSGKVGIGTSSPVGGLEVNNSSGIKITRPGYSQYMDLYPANNNVPTILGLGGNGIHIGTTTTTGIHVDGSDNVGIGTTSPSAKLHVDVSNSGVTPNSYANTLFIESSSNTGLTIASGTSSYSSIYFANSTDNDKARIEVVHSDNSMRFTNNASERMRIDSSGRVGIANTAPNYNLEIGESDGVSNRGLSFNLNNNVGQIRTRSNLSDTQTHYEIINSNGVVGTIRTVGSATQFNTSSDYRLKENVNYDFDATTRLKQLKPARFNFIADANTTVDGFLAHEVSSIVPEAISGEKDAMKTEEYEVTPAVLDDDGNVITEAVMGTREVPEYQGIDQSKLVPLLVKTIQELEARITQLENA